MNIGKKLKVLRESNNVSKTSLAIAVGVSQSYISQIESGKKTNITLHTIINICDFFSISLKELFEDELPELSIHQNKIIKHVTLLNDDEARVVWGVMEQFLKKSK